MNKFNLPRRNIQKERRQKRAERKKQQKTTRSAAVKNSVPEADGSTALALKVSSSTHVPYMSGKRRAKLQKKWRRAQKEALQSGLVTMQDIEMMTGEAEEEAAGPMQGAPKPMKKAKFSMKKRAKLRSKSFSVSQAVADDGADAMLQ